MIHSPPPWCARDALRKVYVGKIRDGQFGQKTAETYEVWECATARLGYLHPFPEIDYSDETYRVSVNKSADIEQYFKLHAAQQPDYLALLGMHLQPEQVVADCGCGGGSLLDLVKKKTGGRTIAIEPYIGYHQSLADRGHEVHPTVEAALTQGLGGSADIALSFYVIEHVIDPVVYLSAMRRLVRPGGMAVILTPNWDDILMKVDPDRMEPFFYRRVHNYYFTAAALAWVGELAGWKPVDNIFYHEFGLANTLLWLRDGKPAGHTRCPGVDETMDASWRKNLERIGNSNNVGIVLKNGR